MGKVCFFLQISEQLDMVIMVEGLSVLVQLKILKNIYFYF